MVWWKSRKTLAGVLILCALGIMAFILAIVSGNDRQNPSLQGPLPAKDEGFTFFDIGVDTRLTDALRDQLGEKLGSAAEEKWGTLDLSLDSRDFFQQKLPGLDALNRRLNTPAGERVEHNTTKLRYRYARGKKVPFEYVELVFANATQKPLLFRITAPKEGAIVIETLKNKYGEPQPLPWHQGQFLLWEKNRSLLIVSIDQNRYGEPEYHTVIYFVPNLEELVDSEQQAAQRRAEEVQKKGKTAF